MADGVMWVHDDLDITADQAVAGHSKQCGHGRRVNCGRS